MKPFRFCTFICLLFFSSVAKADQWRDPSWRELIDSSDVIALITYTSNGMYRAEAKVLTIYKGGLTVGDRIWITGFSNRYGPYDSVSKGQTFLVFLNQNVLSDRSKQYWDEEVKEDPSLMPYYSALKSKTAYSVWTPTAGDLRVKNGTVQYDLLQTSIYSKQRFYPLAGFETFLRFAIVGRATDAFYSALLLGVTQSPKSEQTAQRLMMLTLTQYSEYKPVYAQLTKHKDPPVRFALAQLLANVKTDHSRDLLIGLLDDKNSFVLGEAVRQLASEPKEIVGPIFLRKLTGAGKGVAGRDNIMNPIVNTLNGGQVEIIETLGKLHYTDAIPTLLPLLDSDDDYTFKLVLETVKDLGGGDYAPYLIRHLNKGSKGLLFTISSTIAQDSLVECLPALMNYITTLDRSVHPTPDYLVSTCCGLGHFRSDTIKQFLVSDFLSLLKKEIKWSGVDTKRKWVEAYLETFQKLGIDTLKTYLYDAMYEYYGLNYQFKTSPELFAVKKRVEDSLVSLAKNALPADSILAVNAVVFLSMGKEGEQAVQDYVLRYTAKEGTSFEHMNRLLNNAGIPQTHLIANINSFYHLYASRNMLSFDEGVLQKFLEYLAASPDRQDVLFLHNLKDYHFPQTNYEKRKLQGHIDTATKNLK